MSEKLLSDLESDRARLLSRESAATWVADILRARIAEGYFLPGDQLPENAIGGALGVSRNTLREAFRLLSRERLVMHQLNRGVFVRTPTIEDVEDLYRVRRVVECGVVSKLRRPLPDLTPLVEAVNAGKAADKDAEWQRLGTANIRFHQAIAGLSDSPRLEETMRGLLAELRLVFHQMDDPRALHEPYLDGNSEILGALQDGNPKAAARLLERYLDQAEAEIRAAYGRRLKLKES